MKRFYTCPLDQVVQEMDQNNSDKSVSLAFSRLFSDHENQEVVFTDKFFDILKLFCNSVLRITNKVTAQQLADEDTEKFVINERGLFALNSREFFFFILGNSLFRYTISSGPDWYQAFIYERGLVCFKLQGASYFREQPFQIHY